MRKLRVTLEFDIEVNSNATDLEIIDGISKWEKRYFASILTTTNPVMIAQDIFSRFNEFVRFTIRQLKK